MEIEQLPDYPAAQQIAAALWRSRATVFIGAGFSRNADLNSPDSPLPPLWNGLADAMVRQLYSGNEEQAPSDPIKLAEEYRALFGQAALDDFVREHIRDATWAPATAHRLLLELPWSDVLTTNYDTLLERAALEINDRSYEPVLIESDLARSRAPRIVKLHGSVGISEHFILAEEDYRTYPAKHAAFVNFVRQSFVENELCLLGFSGDDPNFLQWSGWVRDHLGSSSRRIFLVGLLNISVARRKYLEARNVAPIDLAPLVAELDDAERHKAAALRFIDYLKSAQPVPAYAWAPAKLDLNGAPDDFRRRHTDPAYAAETFRRAVTAWVRDRETYPAWLICPEIHRSRLSFSAHGTPWPTGKTLEALDDGERARVIYEILWRQKVSFRSLDPTLVELATEYARPTRSCGLGRSEQLEMASILASQARAADDTAQFESWAALIEEHAAAGSDALADISYQRALQARALRNMAAVEALMSKIDGPDPAWGLRRAGLWIDLGDVDRAEATVTATLADLRRRQRQDRESVWVISRRAWAEWLARVLGQNRLVSPSTRWTEEFRLSHSDPWVIRDAIAEDLADAVKKRRESEVLKPQFEPGQYTDPSKTVHIVSDLTGPEEPFRRLVEDVGIPHLLDFIDLLGDSVQNVVAVTNRTKANDWLRLIGMMRKISDPLMDRVFGRASVAAISSSDRQAIVAAIRREMDFWRSRLPTFPPRRTFLVERIALLIELLARFAVCADSDVAELLYKLALDLGAAAEFRHIWWFEAIEHLAEFSLSAVAPEHRHTLIGQTLQFPTASEAKAALVNKWPAAWTWMWQMRSGAERPAGLWDKRIAELIDEAAGPGDASDAVLRLAALANSNHLTPSESERFGCVLWSKLDEEEPPLPRVDRLNRSAMLWLPHPEGIDVADRLRQRLFNVPSAALDLQAVVAIQTLADRDLNAGAELQPSAAEAAALFDNLVAWRPKTSDHALVQAFEGPGEARKANAISIALGRVVTKALSEADRTDFRLKSLIAFLDAVDDTDALEALIAFVDGHPECRSAIADRIRRAILAGKANTVHPGIRALLAWLRQSRNTFPEPMIERVLASLEVRRWPGLTAILLGLRDLVDEGVLAPHQIERLDAPLGDLIDETDYARIVPGSVEAVSFSLVRHGCVLLAKALSAKGIAGVAARAWLELAPTDPLPEVRYAVVN